MDRTCIDYRVELSAFIDGQLEPKLQAEVQSHLNECPNCAEELATLKALTKFLSSEMAADKVEMPDLWQSIQEQMPSVCELMQEDMSAYLDGELTAPAQEGVNKHLKECQTCLDVFKRLNAANRLVAKALELPASVKVDLWPAVKARLNEDCALIRSELSAYIDQEVATLRHRSITNHLIDCQDCRLQFTQLSSVGDIIRDQYKPEFAEDFDLWPGVKSKLQVVPFAAKNQQQQQATNNKRTRKRWYLPAGVAAAVAAVAVSAYGFFSQTASADTISSEGYLIESALMEPSDIAEAVVYEQQ